MDTRRPDDTAARLQRLVEDLKRRGCIRTAGVEAAFRAVPRHLFVPDVPLEDVYADNAIPTKRGTDGGFISSSSQPAIMAIMLEQLSLAPGHHVLEIGAGTGYNAALMAHIVGPTGVVVAMDIDDDLVTSARDHLAAAEFDRVRVICGDGGRGYPEGAPYDRIILTIGAWDITPGWREQLRVGGRLLLPLSIKGPQLCVAFERVDGHLESVSIEECGFMPFELFLRTFGPDDAFAERVIEYVKAWDAAGRPAPKELRIRAYPKDAGYRPAGGEIVVDKRWSRLVLDRPGRVRSS